MRTPRPVFLSFAELVILVLLAFGVDSPARFAVTALPVLEACATS